MREGDWPKPYRSSHERPVWQRHVSERFDFHIKSSSQGVTANPMKLKFIGTLAAVLLASAFAFSQANSSAALPSAPGAANDPPAVQFNPNAKIAAININEAV